MIISATIPFHIKSEDVRGGVENRIYSKPLQTTFLLLSAGGGHVLVRIARHVVGGCEQGDHGVALLDELQHLQHAHVHGQEVQV